MSSDITSIESQFNINITKSKPDKVYRFHRFRLESTEFCIFILPAKILTKIRCIYNESRERG